MLRVKLEGRSSTIKFCASLNAESSAHAKRKKENGVHYCCGKGLLAKTLRFISQKRIFFCKIITKMSLTQSYESNSESDDGSISQSIDRRSSRIAKSGPTVLSTSYLDFYSTKNDLVRRLRKVVDALADQYVEVNMPDNLGLGTLTAVLITDR